jgi:hypothetical protein
MNTKCTDMYYHSLSYILQCIGVHAMRQQLTYVPLKKKEF